VIGAILTFFDEQKNEFGGERCAVSLRTLKSDYRRPLVAACIAAWTRKAVEINNSLVKGDHNGKPSVEVLTKNFVLGNRMRFDRPKCLLGKRHISIKSKRKNLVGK